VVVLTGVLGGLGYARSRTVGPAGTLRVYRPGQAIPLVSGVVSFVGAVTGVAPTRPTPSSCATPRTAPYLTPLPAGAAPTHPEGVAIGQWSGAAGTVAARYNPTTGPDDPRIPFPALSAVRYDTNGYTVMVTTCTVAPEVRETPLYLGNTEITLRPGQFAYLSESRSWLGAPNQGQWEPYNVITFTDGRIVVGVSSALPSADLVAFARGVVVR
jgi:hypothetical protein